MPRAITFCESGNRPIGVQIIQGSSHSKKCTTRSASSLSIMGLAAKNGVKTGLRARSDYVDSVAKPDHHGALALMASVTSMRDTKPTDALFFPADSLFARTLGSNPMSPAKRTDALLLSAHNLSAAWRIRGNRRFRIVFGGFRGLLNPFTREGVTGSIPVAPTTLRKFHPD